MTYARIMPGIDRLARDLIHRAARHAPDSLSGRLEEEWLAELQDMRGSLSRLRFAFGCGWATGVIARDLRTAPLPATGSTIGQGRFLSFARDNGPHFSRRTGALVLVAGLHVLVFYGFVTGLDVKLVKLLPTRFEAKVIEMHRSPDVPLPPPPLTPPPRLDVTPPEILPPIERDTTHIFLASSTHRPGSSRPPTRHCRRILRSSLESREDPALAFRALMISIRRSPSIWVRKASPRFRRASTAKDV